MTFFVLMLLIAVLSPSVKKKVFEVIDFFQIFSKVAGNVPGRPLCGVFVCLECIATHVNIERLIRIHSASTEFIIYDGGKGDKDGEKV